MSKESLAFYFFIHFCKKTGYILINSCFPLVSRTLLFSMLKLQNKCDNCIWRIARYTKETSVNDSQNSFSHFLFVHEMNVCLVGICLVSFSFLFIHFFLFNSAYPLVCPSVPVWFCDALFVCVQWGEDGCSVSSNRAGWTGWLCQPPRSSGSTNRQRKWNHTRQKVMTEEKKNKDRGMNVVFLSHKSWRSSEKLCQPLILCCVPLPKSPLSSFEPGNSGFLLWILKAVVWKEHIFFCCIT